MRVKAAGVLVVAFCACLVTSSAYAGPIVSFDDTTGVGLGNPPFTLGYSFTANTNLTLTDLGVFDDSQNGLVDSYDVGVWDSIGNLLASTTVPNGIGGTLINQFRYISIAPINLISGASYSIGALFLDGNDPLVASSFGGVTNFGTDPNVSFVSSGFQSGGSLSDPTTSAGGTQDFGPNAIVAPVPEPTTLTLLGLGLCGVVRRRFFAKA